MSETEIKITGMTCSGCVKSVTRVLEQFPGVNRVDVSLEQGNARVRYDDALVNSAQLRKAIEEAGYDAS